MALAIDLYIVLNAFKICRDIIAHVDIIPQRIINQHRVIIATWNLVIMENAVDVKIYLIIGQNIP